MRLGRRAVSPWFCLGQTSSLRVPKQTVSSARKWSAADQRWQARRRMRWWAPRALPLTRPKEPVLNNRGVLWLLRQATPGLAMRGLLALLPRPASPAEVEVPMVHLTVQPRMAVMGKAVVGRVMEARAQPVVARKPMVGKQRLVERLVAPATAYR